MEKNKVPCKIMEDLLPSYLDEILSDSVNEAVELHLESCEACRKKLGQLKSELAEGQVQIEENDAAFVKGIKRYKHYVIGMAIGAGIPLLAFLAFIIWLMFISMNS